MIVQGIRTSAMSNVISAMQARRFMRKGCETFLAVILDSERGQVNVEKIPVVREFPDVFPEELPVIPLEREVDLAIEIVPGIVPMSRAPEDYLKFLDLTCKCFKIYHLIIEETTHDKFLNPNIIGFIFMI